MTDNQDNNTDNNIPEGFACTSIPTPAIPGINPNTTVTVHCFVCNIHVTPAPIQIYGNVNYYYDPSKNVAGSGFKSRHFDFLARHSGCSHTVPDYYLTYGDKYIKKFTIELYPKLSPAGKSWLVNARKKLQEYMEKGFEQNLTSEKIIIKAKTSTHVSYEVKLPSKECLELDNERFRAFAFGTHPPAYTDGGFHNMTTMDKAYLMDTIDGKDFWSLETVKQVGKTGWGEFLDHPLSTPSSVGGFGVFLGKQAWDAIIPPAY